MSATYSRMLHRTEPRHFIVQAPSNSTLFTTSRTPAVKLHVIVAKPRPHRYFHSYLPSIVARLPCLLNFKSLSAQKIGCMLGLSDETPISQSSDLARSSCLRQKNRENVSLWNGLHNLLAEISSRRGNTRFSGNTSTFVARPSQLRLRSEELHVTIQ